MTMFGYARVSTTDQDLDLQLASLKAAGCDVIRSEKRSGASTEGRAELRNLLDFVRVGDVLIQQGTNHAWVNRGVETCRIAFVLIDAKEP